MHKFDCTRHRDDSVAIIRLAAFELAHFRLGIEMRSDGSNHFYGADSVGDCHHFVAVNSLLASPGAPLPLDRASGVDENSIEIEQNGSAAKDCHCFYYHREG